MKSLLITIQAISGLILIALILIQVKGQGFVRGWGSPASFTRRGLEKIVFRLTFALAFIFVAVSILSIAI